MGDGKQGIPWIHIDDEVNAIIFLIENTIQLEGYFNLSAPAPVSNAEFTKSIAFCSPSSILVPCRLKLLLSLFWEK